MLQTLGVLIPYLTGVYFGEVLCALHEAARERGVRLLVIRTGDQSNSYDLPLSLDMAAGWIVMLESASEAHLEVCLAEGRPVCTVGYVSGVKGCSSVRTDNASGIRMAVAALQQVGHRRIAFLGYSGVADFVERERAFCDVLASEGIESPPLVDAGGFDFVAGHRGLNRLCDNGVDFTALICGNDQIAMGAIAGLRDRGIKVPEQVAVFGYDNSVLANDVKELLSSVDQNLGEMARAAVGEVLARIADPARAPQALRVDARLVDRLPGGNTARAPHPDDLRMIPRRLAFATIATADEMAYLIFHPGDDVLVVFLRRIRLRLKYGLACAWNTVQQPLIRPGVVVPDEVVDLMRSQPFEPRAFPPLELEGTEAGAGGDLALVIPPDQHAPDRPMVVAYLPERALSDSFALELFAHEFERTLTTSSLRHINADLATALETLKTTQLDLMRAEKRAALISVVAGVAHEMNTPIGNGRLALGAVEAQLERLREAIGGGLRRTQLEAFISTMMEGVAVADRNLAAAADLVQDFKAITSHEADQPRQVFRLRSAIANTVDSLRRQFEGAGVELEIIAGEELSLDSYPLAIMQILRELIENAVDHRGKVTDLVIRISLHADSNECTLAVSDNGPGVDPALAGQIFDPFYTTRMGATRGLGLSIAKSVAEDVIGGRLRLVAGQAAGSYFELTIPLH